MRKILPQQACPCCQQTMPEYTFFGLDLSPFEKVIVTAIQRRGQNGVIYRTLWDDVYPKNSCPASENALRVSIHRLNAKLRPIGKAIVIEKFCYKIVDYREEVRSGQKSRGTV